MKKSTIYAAITIILIALFSFLFSSCESCNRQLKSIDSDFGGLNRTAVLMDYNGDTIKTWEGKFDIRDNGADNQIFFDLDGKRVWIQGGIFVSEEK